LTASRAAGPLHPGVGGRDVLLVDPSLFTAPYDAALSAGLRAAGITPLWATRALRPGEGDAFCPADEVQRFFYPLTDGPRRRTGGVAKLIKAVEHVRGLRQVAMLAARRDVAAVHFQWAVLPRIDATFIAAIRRTRPVVLTVHDTEPFNGKKVSVAQRSGFRSVLAAADRLIVHTQAGRTALTRMGLPESRVAVVPHGLLGTGGPSPVVDRPVDAPWTVVQFGKIQDYKGVDLLVEALGRLPDRVRQRIRMIVAGEPLIPVEPLRARAEALGLSDTLEWRLGYLDDGAVERVLAQADAFVFPYRAIEASGVFLLVAARQKWLVASDLGAFRDLIGTDGGAGELVAPGEVDALARALERSVGRRPTRRVADAVPGWDAIGAATAQVYRDAAESWTGRKAA